MKSTIILAGLLVAGLTGCAQRIPYQLPQGVPAALISSKINGAYGHNDSLEVFVLEGDCKGPVQSKRLFDISKSVSKPPGYVMVPANAPLRLRIEVGLSAGRSCSVHMETVLQEGGVYSLHGGVNYSDSFLPSPQNCSFGVTDDATRLPVRLQNSCAR